MKALILIASLGVIAMMSEVLRFKKALLPVVALGLLSAFVLNALDWNTSFSYYSDMVIFDNYAIAFNGAVIAITFLWLFISREYFISESSRSEHAALVLFALCGAMLMISHANLTMLFIGIEILSISLYVLASSDKSSLRSNEAGLKYFLMGAFATGFLLFGIALVYGATGTFNLREISAYTALSQGNAPLFLYAGILLMMVGLLFKVSAVPFHFWAPDVYEGSPTLITAFMATVVKTAAFAAFFRLFSSCFSELSSHWGTALAVISAITMLGGNILAVFQRSFKRMLAYSSVAHAGYLLLAIVSMNGNSAGGLFFYTVAYSIASLGAFSVLHAISHNGDEQISNLKGIGHSRPGVALFLSIIMLSLAGIPPVAGFFAKYYLFLGALESHQNALVLVAILSSLIGVYYYFKVIYTMFQPRDPEAGEVPYVIGTHRILLVVAALLSLAIGIFPSILQGLF